MNISLSLGLKINPSAPQYLIRTRPRNSPSRHAYVTPREYDMHRPVTRHENSKGEYTMKIQLKSSQKIMPLQTGKRVRTCLMVGEIYNTPLEYVRAVL
jgi:hypothetical protein